MTPKRRISALAAAALALAACTQGTPAAPPPTQPPAQPPTTATSPPAASTPTTARTTPIDSTARAPYPTPTPLPPVDVPQVPPQEQRVLMQGFYQQIPFDGIRPVYDPRFVNADDAPMHPEELVIGIAVGDEAKAYPVSVLRFREMVNDEIAGIPILVTW